MRFSILVPVYNAEKYLAECIESVLNQTYSDFELILVNDGSTDNSGKICNEYANNDSRIDVFHKQNEGQLSSRCLAIEKAVGDYCIFLDSDDYLDNDYLEVVNNKIEEYNCDCVIIGWKEIVNGNIVAKVCDEEDIFLTDKRDIYRRCFLSNKYNSMCRKIIKRQIIKQYNFTKYYCVKYGEDLIQSVEILRCCKNLLILSNPLYNYRFNIDSMTHTIDFSKYNVEEPSLTFVIDFLKNNKIFLEKDWTDLRGYYSSLLVDSLINIARSGNMINKQKLVLYYAIYNSHYYKTFLRAKKINKRYLGKKMVLYFLFQHKFFKLDLLLIKISFILKKSTSKNYGSIQ